MEFETIKECRAEINRRAATIDASYLSMQSLFEMIWQFIVFMNGVIVIAMIVLLFVNTRIDTGILNFFKFRHLFAFLVLYFFEGIAKGYAKSVVVNDHIVNAKTEMCRTLLKNCKEYLDLAEWQKKQVFDNDIIPAAGMTISK